MKTAEQLIEELNTLDEHTSIEAKTAFELGTSIMETVCAFSNEPHLGGGYIISAAVLLAASSLQTHNLGRNDKRLEGRHGREVPPKRRFEVSSAAVTARSVDFAGYD